MAKLVPYRLLVLKRRPKKTIAWLGSSPYIWSPHKTKIRRAPIKWSVRRFVNFPGANQNSGPTTWVPHKPKPQRISLIRRPKHRLIAAALALVQATWFPKPKAKRRVPVKWTVRRFVNLPGVNQNSGPTTWTPRRKHHLGVTVQSKKHARKAIAGWAVAPVISFFPPRRKKLIKPPLKRLAHRRVRSAHFIGAATFLSPSSKSWVWNPQAALLNLTLGTISKAWNWVPNTIAGLPFSLGVVSKAWNWRPNAAILISTNIKIIRWNIMRPVLWGILRGEEERPRKGP